MAKGYWIARVDVVNPVGYAEYAKANAAPFLAHKAHFLVRGGAIDALEGISRGRNVVIEFESFEAARACYFSPEYQAALELRKPYSIADVLIVEGVEPPVAAPPVSDVPAGYWIMGIDVTNEDGYRAYAAAGGTADFKPRFLVRGGRQELLEGIGRQRIVLLAFDDVPTARACYQSDGYQKAVKLREGAADVDLIIASGYVGPQPA
ncbi:DUF1330 domain-containing protein [Xanthobacter sp. DSM 24535]|uniref:DUF1330 domain-containing protein n=1 Tax=Roseixanthobacter psychrophilus TaxID=3119917 RepID=UPI00372CBB73